MTQNKFSENAQEPVYLTSTPALAREVRAFLTIQHKDSGDVVWDMPRVYPADTWARELWLETWPKEQQMHPVQELALCERLLEDAEISVLSKTELARSVRKALSFCEVHQIDLGSNHLIDEHKQLATLRDQFQKLIADQASVTNAQVEGLAGERIVQGDVAPPKVIRVIGDPSEYKKSTLDLLEICRAHGADVDFQDPRPQRLLVSSEGVLFPTDADMWVGMAQKARDELEEHPRSRVLILVDDAEAQRADIERALREVFLPHALPGQRFDLPWRFQAGRRLSQYASVDIALSLLRYIDGESSPESASRLLLSPVLFDRIERDIATRVERALRKAGGDRVPLGRIIAMAEKLAKGSGVSKKLTAFSEALEAAPSKALPSEWVEYLDGVLSIFGWPNVAGGADSYVEQELEQWRNGCAVFQSFDRQFGRVPQRVAAKYLTETMATRRFTPKAQYEQPIEIATLEEGRGLQADLIIVAGITDACFPRPLERNAFIAQETLAAYEVPFSTPEDCLERARSWVGALKNSSSRVHVCASRQSNNGSEHALPALLADAFVFRDQASVSTVLSQCVGNVGRVVTEESFVPLTPYEKENKQKGGVSVVKDTSLSPLVGFLNHRLLLNGIEPWSRIAPGTQGNITHKALAALTVDWCTRDAITTACEDEAAMKARIQEVVESCVADWVAQGHYSRSAISLEIPRQVAMIYESLKHETRRALDYQIIGREVSTKDIDFYGLPLSLQIDRIDLVKTDLGPRVLLIDYKTGDVKPGGWSASELREPQLPMYSSPVVLSALEGQLVGRTHGIPTPLTCDGICFDIVTAKKPQKGVQPTLRSWTNFSAGLIPTKGRDANVHIHDWGDQQSQWNARLQEITHAFLSGDVRHPVLDAKDTRYLSDVMTIIDAGSNSINIDSDSEGL